MTDDPTDPWLQLVGRARSSQRTDYPAQIPTPSLSSTRLRAQSLLRWSLWKRGWLLLALVTFLVVTIVYFLHQDSSSTELPVDPTPPSPEIFFQ
jgi:hypothetical protein